MSRSASADRDAGLGAAGAGAAAAAGAAGVVRCTAGRIRRAAAGAAGAVVRGCRVRGEGDGGAGLTGTPRGAVPAGADADWRAGRGGWAPVREADGRPPRVRCTGGTADAGCTGTAGTDPEGRAAPARTEGAPVAPGDSPGAGTARSGATGTAGTPGAAGTPE
ncbi:hypothetical protein ACFQ7O_05535 [Streptomyces sp. NPDC056485]|uniref:hypothetical protein n=1 Tax=Streptomyces sp. NPDC056485 TaxID=3345834 RepID=UPI0036AFEEB5